MIRKAILFDKMDNAAVRCRLCAHKCVIRVGRRGICKVRENREGELCTLVYGNLVAENVDPIEKKPLYHFQPGSLSYSIATCGCNLACSHCQNYSISMEISETEAIPGTERSPEQIVESALTAGCGSISYTYTEPVIFAEFALDCISAAADRNLSNVFVTNGFMTPEGVDLIAKNLDAANVDLKGATEEYYRTVCKGRLEPVLESIRALFSAGVWLEITTLLIPGLNDDDESLGFISEFIASVDARIPWHVSRYQPAYKMQDRPPTPLSSLNKALRFGEKAGLKYVYSGNVSGVKALTLCHACGRMLLERTGFSLSGNHLTGEGTCPDCQTPFFGVV